MFSNLSENALIRVSISCGDVDIEVARSFYRSWRGTESRN